MIQIHTQMDEGVTIGATLISNQVRMEAELKTVSGISAELLPGMALCAALIPSLTLDAHVYLDKWTKGILSNFITADGYHIATADGYLLWVKDE